MTFPDDHLSRTTRSMGVSFIREMLKATKGVKGMISLAGGLPSPESFPSGILGGLFKEVVETDGADVLQYGPTEGDDVLKRAINIHEGEADVPLDRLIITEGSTNAIYLFARSVIDPGDVVLCESPTYLGAISSWNVMRPRWVEVPTDDEGMDPAGLEAALAEHPNAKAIYVIPNFQNPSGRTWSLERRRRFMEIVERHDVHVVEDNPYGELRFEGTPIASLKSLDRRGRVIALGTFSKVFCPGLRIAWIAAENPVYEKLVILKQGADLQTSTLGQLQVNRYLEENDLDADIARIIPVYRERRDAMLAALDAEMPAGVHFTRPSGGLFLWMTLPERLNARTLLDECVRQNVAFVPGGAFYPNGGHENTLRLNYSNMPIERIQEGVRRLARAVVKEMERSETLEEVPATP